MIRPVTFASAITLMCAQLAASQAAPPATEAGAEFAALKNLPAKGGATLQVSSPSFKPDGDIPFEFTQYKGNTFPGLAWSQGPGDTRSYVVIMQDLDAMRGGQPILHWTMGNIPATVTKLDSGTTTPPPGAQNGPNIRGTNMPYMGPRTPQGPKHRYHFQVFALDMMLDADAFASYEALTNAMKGHVLASGEVVGLGQFMTPK